MIGALGEMGRGKGGALIVKFFSGAVEAGVVNFGEGGEGAESVQEISPLK